MRHSEAGSKPLHGRVVPAKAISMGAPHLQLSDSTRSPPEPLCSCILLCAQVLGLALIQQLVRDHLPSSVPSPLVRTRRGRHLCMVGGAGVLPVFCRGGTHTSITTCYSCCCMRLMLTSIERSWKLFYEKGKGRPVQKSPPGKASPAKEKSKGRGCSEESLWTALEYATQ